MDERELDDFLNRGSSRRDKEPTKPKADETESELNMDGKEKKKGSKAKVSKPKATAKSKAGTQRGKQNKIFGFGAGAVIAALAKAGANKAQIYSPISSRPKTPALGCLLKSPRLLSG